MFGAFANLATGPSPFRPQINSDDIPPPTPIALPRYQPIAQDDVVVDPAKALPQLLKSTGRSTAVLGPLGFAAIGLDLQIDVDIQQLIPDAANVPDFARWEQLTQDEAQAEGPSTRSPLRNGNLSPGCQIYCERRKELSNDNESAFRTVRRLSPPRGGQQARLGSAYEFFRCLEQFTAYWDDPTRSPDFPQSPEIHASQSYSPGETEPVDKSQSDSLLQVPRFLSGSSMPPEYRQKLVSAFIKMVAYDFGCNVSASHVEPRLHLASSSGLNTPRRTHIPLHFHFIFQGPQTREMARAGMTYGPVAAVSSRTTLDFATPDVETAQSLDLAREILSALITAQHRAREKKSEIRFGEGQWWTSKPRWGGGIGGPIGREIENDGIMGDKDTKPNESNSTTVPMHKKQRKNMAIYDNYRMVRPPASSWDRKTQYQAIGKQRSADYDDIFVVSSLFHHVSFLRVRVPLRLLEVLDGSHEPDVSRRSWGKLQAWRSPWYDLFSMSQRVEALKLLWSMMEYQMRQDTGEDDANTTTGQQR